MKRAKSASRGVGKKPANRAGELSWWQGARQVLRWGIVILLVLLPFHAFLTTWLASATGHFDLVRIWKELLLFAFCSIAGYLVIKRPRVARQLLSRRLVQAVLAYLVLTILMFVFGLVSGHVGPSAAIYGVLINARFLGFFLLVLIVAGLSRDSGDAAPPRLAAWRQYIFIPAALVVGFGVLQFALPAGFLSHFGYSPATIPAYQTVDNKPDYVRLQSTLRGPNPFGAYLVLIIALLLAAGLASQKRWQYVFLGAASLLALYGTFSRSAWFGALLAIGIVLLLATQLQRYRLLLTGVGVVLVILALSGVIIVRHSATFQNVLFHTSNSSHSPQSSNAQRVSGLEEGWHDVVHNPLGQGVGSAGPASVRNTKEPARIAENYFLQIGQESGWLGMFLFTLVIVLTGVELFARRTDPLALGLLAALVGLTFVSFLSHAWADDTLAYLFWGLAGLALAQGLEGRPGISLKRHAIKTS